MNYLKFRIWDKIHKRWETDFLSIELDGTVINGYGDPDSNCIVQQFAGIYDYQGNEIYEGDVVLEFNNNGTQKAAGVCKRSQNIWEIYSYPNSSIRWHGWKTRVIGNINEIDKLLVTLKAEGVSDIVLNKIKSEGL